ncbi:hypothetical protein AB205_0078720, partial [Aquarana catesbeiana]
ASKCLEETLSKAKDLESRVIKVKPTLASKCVQTAVGRAEDLNEWCVALINKSNDALTKHKGPKPVSKTENLISLNSRVESDTRKVRPMISRRHMWIDLLKVGVPREEIDGIPTPALFRKWKQVVRNGRFSHINCFCCHKMGHFARMCHAVKTGQLQACVLPRTAQRDMQVYSLRWKSMPFRESVSRQQWAPYNSFAVRNGQIEKCEQ